MNHDILLKIESDFGGIAQEVIDLIEKAVHDHYYLNDDRIIRCIVFISNKNIEELKKTIDLAILDPRDVMLYAEYSYDDKILKRIRDFNNTFDHCEDDVSE
jgi:hypothetical protein